MKKIPLAPAAIYLFRVFAGFVDKRLPEWGIFKLCSVQLSRSDQEYHVGTDPVVVTWNNIVVARSVAVWFTRCCSVDCPSSLPTPHPNSLSVSVPPPPSPSPFLSVGLWHFYADAVTWNASIHHCFRFLFVVCCCFFVTESIHLFRISKSLSFSHSVCLCLCL